MADVKVHPEPGGTDINFDGRDIETDGGLTSAIILSLETDAAPGGGPGYWGDTLDALPRLRGSRLHLIKKNTAESRARFRAYAEESLQWMVDAGVASEVEVVLAAFTAGAVLFDIVVKESDPLSKESRFRLAWETERQRIGLTPCR